LWWEITELCVRNRENCRYLCHEDKNEKIKIKSVCCLIWKIHINGVWWIGKTITIDGMTNAKETTKYYHETPSVVYTSIAHSISLFMSVGTRWRERRGNLFWHQPLSVVFIYIYSTLYFFIYLCGDKVKMKKM